MKPIGVLCLIVCLIALDQAYVGNCCGGRVTYNHPEKLIPHIQKYYDKEISSKEYSEVVRIDWAAGNYYGRWYLYVDFILRDFDCKKKDVLGGKISKKSCKQKKVRNDFSID